MTTNTTTATYTAAYSDLSKAVESVNNCKDIDEVANFVKSGVEAYQVCMERVNKVKEMIVGLQGSTED